MLVEVEYKWKKNGCFIEVKICSVNVTFVKTERKTFEAFCDRFQHNSSVLVCSKSVIFMLMRYSSFQVVLQIHIRCQIVFKWSVSR